MVADALILVAPWAEVAPECAGRALTAADLAALPDDGWQYELVEGNVVRMPPPKGSHGRLESKVDRVLHAYVESRGLGEVYVGEMGFDLTLPGEPRQTVLGADVAFLRAERVPPKPAGDEEEPYIAGPPDLAVEIASPSQHRPEPGAKAWRWLRRGARLVWVVWPARRQVDVWTPGRDEPAPLRMGDALDGADVLPGFAYALADLFA